VEPSKKSPTTELDLIWGADAIANELGVNLRQAFYLLDKGEIPAKKVGRKWCTSRRGLRAHFASITGEVA